MDIEFHYYMTYLTATRAGLSTTDAEILAYSSQYVDENNRSFWINRGQPNAYRNYITQTKNILKPTHVLMRIYPIFHFIPGDPLSPTAQRKDGKLHQLNTTPNSKNANRIFDRAIASGDFYRIGIAAHSYVDTWAHQNFVGYYDAFNAMSGFLSRALPNIGHADAKHKPDWPALVWQDCRLTHETIDNRQRFLEAAHHLFHKLRQFVQPNGLASEAAEAADSLWQDLDQAIGEADPTNRHKALRIQRYRDLSECSRYGGQRLPIFDSKYWFNQALRRQPQRFTDWIPGVAKRRFWHDTYVWKDNYQNSHWYQFQAAAKVQQTDAWEILKQDAWQGLTLINL
ncbi:DUF6765 family protein [Leptothoe kymatousa]|nr:DUF6765 family protein [Leptothoe kymatousa]